MKKLAISAALATFALIGVVGLTTTYGRAQDQEESVGTNTNQMHPMVKISPAQAIKAALGKIPGKPLNANFEFDEGHWVYGVMIVHNHKIDEVEIDPVSGKVGAAESVTPADEAKETLDDLTKAMQ